MIKQIVNKLPVTAQECPYSIKTMAGSYVCSNSITRTEKCDPKECRKLKPITEYLKKRE